MTNPEQLREELAKLAHEQWSGWMEYLFSKCTVEVGGEMEGIIIPKWAVERWIRQSRTSYDNLSEDEKESDRKEADKFIAVFEQTYERIE